MHFIVKVRSYGVLLLPLPTEILRMLHIPGNLVGLGSRSHAANPDLYLPSPTHSRLILIFVLIPPAKKEYDTARQN
jgi:hypothetical protein